MCGVVAGCVGKAGLTEGEIKDSKLTVHYTSGLPWQAKLPLSHKSLLQSGARVEQVS